MTGDPFRSPAAEVAALTKELAEVRAALRDLSQRFNQIDRHVKRAFHIKPEPPARRPPRDEGGGARPVAHPPTKSVIELLGIYERLVDDSRADPAVAEGHLRRMDVGDLRSLAYELGLPGGTKPSKLALIRAILGRVRESLLLSKNTNVTLPRSVELAETVTPEDDRASDTASSLEDGPARRE